MAGYPDVGLDYQSHEAHGAEIEAGTSDVLYVACLRRIPTGTLTLCAILVFWSWGGAGGCVTSDVCLASHGVLLGSREATRYL